MKFLNYLNEIKFDDESFGKDITNRIAKDCKPFINEGKKLNTKRLLYTGKETSILYTVRKVRQDRKPMNTPLDLHTLIDDWFYKKFKVRARSNSVFATFDEGTTGVYGGPYCIFPIGNYTAISSRNVRDLYYEISRYGKDFKENNPNKLEELKAETIESLENFNYKKGLQKHLNEQMIICDKYLIVKDKYEADLINFIKNTK